MHKTFLLTFALASAVGAGAQTVEPSHTMTLKHERLTTDVPAPVHPVPHERQIKWMETEFYAFFHYGMDTFTGEEWGFGNEEVSTYNPTETPNPGQWLDAAKSAHMNGGIAVVKHHDGFCLWPTKTTDHCVSGDDTPAGFDVAKAFAEAAKARNMKYGFYVSPWDRNSEKYGRPEYVTDVFLKQCEELSQYGNDQFEMWFDGANGGDGWYGGNRGNRSIDESTYYDVPNLRWLVHQTNKDCVMWGVGGEARWIGNEAGYAGETNWCNFNRGTDTSNAIRNTGAENGWMWLPGESDAKSSGGWFWSPTKNSYTSAQGLFKMYLETVGRNSTLILNLPPTTNGRLNETLVNNLEQLGRLLDERLTHNFATTTEGASIVEDKTTESRGNDYAAANVLGNNTATYYATANGTTAADITIDLGNTRRVHYVMLQEYIRLGQRVKAFTIETSTDGTNWTKFGGNIPTTTIGYKRIIPQSGSTGNYGNGIDARYVRVKITDCRSVPVISNIAVY